MPNNTDLPKWKTTASEYVVNDRWLTVRADTCETPGGDVLSPWYVLEYSEWVNCLVVDNDDNVILLQHYRHGVDKYVQEIVGGNVDPGYSPLQTVKKEMQEEIGYENGQVYATGVAYANPSNQNNKLHTFLAVGGTCTASTYKEIGADFAIEKMPFTEFVKAVTDPTSETVYQSLHLAAIFRALNFIRYSAEPSADIAHLRQILP